MRLLVPLFASVSILAAGCSGDPTTAATAPTTATASSTAVGGPSSAAVLASPEDVRTVQNRLRQLDFYGGEASGSWNTATEAAVQSFQRANGLPVGKLDQATLRAMGLSSVVMGSGRLTDVALARGPMMMGQGQMMGHGQMGQGQMGQGQMRHGMGAGAQGQHAMAGIAPAAGPGPGAHMQTGRHLEPASAREVQQKLAEGGFYKTKVDGVWGPRSQQALLDFQDSRDLSVTGRLTPETVTALGLDQSALKWRMGPRAMRR